MNIYIIIIAAFIIISLICLFIILQLTSKSTPVDTSTSSSFEEQLNISPNINIAQNTISPVTSIVTNLTTSLKAGLYSKGNITFTISDKISGIAGFVVILLFRDISSGNTITRAETSFLESDRPSKNLSFDLTGKFNITGNEEILIVVSNLKSEEQKINITKGTVSFSN